MGREKGWEQAFEKAKEAITAVEPLVGKSTASKKKPFTLLKPSPLTEEQIAQAEEQRKRQLDEDAHRAG